MKKIVSVILFLAMLCTVYTAFGLPASAEGGYTVAGKAESFAVNPDWTTGGSESVTIPGGESLFNVKGSYNANAKTDVYSVDITWGEMAFDYNTATEKWDAESHKWVADKPAGWMVKNAGGNIITLENNSSKAVTATFAFAADSTCPEVTGVFTENALTLPVPVEDTPATPYTVTFTPGGTLPADHTDGAAFGSITVTIN